MAYTYGLKVVVSGKQVETYKYKKLVWRDYRNKKEKIIRIPKQLNLFKRQKKKKSIFSISRTKTELRRLTNSNPQLNKFLTLTFAENITELKEANYILNQFIKRISYKYPDFQYLAVPEFQKRGAVHYHMLCNLPLLVPKEIETIWGQGFINIRRIDNVNNVGAYISKYLGKELNEKTFGKKKFFRSQIYSNRLNLSAIRPQNL